MKSLGYSYTPDDDYQCQSGDSGANGTIDYTRQDYPCNYQSCGERIGYTAYGPCSDEGTVLPPGQTMSWSFVIPEETPNHANYVTLQTQF